MESFATDYEHIQELLRQMIYDSKPITMDEKGELVALLNDSKLRFAIIEVLQDIVAPRPIENMDCLNLLSDLIRFILTLFVHENAIDYQLLRAMLESSSYLYHVSTQTKRKSLLTHFIMDHGIWADLQAWKECIDINIKDKMEESSERAKRRQ